MAGADERVADLLVGVRTALKAADLNVAERLADAALRCAPGNPDLLQMFGEILLAAGQPARALERLERATSLRPAPQTQASIALALLALHRNSDALAQDGSGPEALRLAHGRGAGARGRRRSLSRPAEASSAGRGLTETLDACGEVLVGLTPWGTSTSSTPGGGGCA